MNNKIIEYKLCTGDNDTFEEQMEKFLSEGYQPYGSFATTSKIFNNIIQPMVKYER